MYSDVYLDINDLMGTGDIYGSFGSTSPFGLYQRDTKMLMISCIVSCIVLLWTFICLWRIYKKLGLKGWAILVPFYGPYVLYKRILGKGWLFLLSVVPGVNFIVMFVLYTKMAKVFGKGFLFGLSLIIFTPITYTMLAFGKAMPVDVMDDSYDTSYDIGEEQPSELSIVEEPVEPKKPKKSKKRKASKVEEPIEEPSIEEPIEEPVQEVYAEPSREELIAEKKLNKLEGLLAEGLISKAQYNRKRREIESSLK